MMRALKVLIPFAIVLTAVVSAVVLAYGTDPAVVDRLGGLSTLVLVRRLQWVLLIICIIPCLTLVVRVAAGWDKLPWLVCLAPVVALLVVGLGVGDRHPVRVVDADGLPTMADIDRTKATIGDEEYVVGVVFGSRAFAFPYRSLYRTPIVQLTDFDRRLVVIHSPFANLSTAVEVSREVRAEDLEYVAAPDNSSLVYNRKFGEFIEGITGRRPDGSLPTNVLARRPTVRTTLAQWRALHPDTKIMLPTADDTGPDQPIEPKYAFKPAAGEHASLYDNAKVILLRSDPPVAIEGDAVKDQPVSVTAGTTPLVVWRSSGVLRAFVARVDDGVWLTFSPVNNPAVDENDVRKTRDARDNRIQLRDRQTGSLWTRDGRCLSGKMVGKKLLEVEADENIYWGVCRTWWRNVRFVRPSRVVN